MDHEVLAKRLKEQHVAYLELWFTDVLGITKNVAIPADRLSDALAGRLRFDGSSLAGFVRTEESDMLLAPDPSTFMVVPAARAGSEPIGRFICDVKNADGSAFDGCPRTALQRALRRLPDPQGSLMVAPEIEFYLFNLDPTGRPQLATDDQAGYFDLSPLENGEEARRRMVLSLQSLGIAVAGAHHEVAAGQHEIDLAPAPALQAADNLVTMRAMVRHIARAYNLHATFMPKPLSGQNGSGLHLHMTLATARAESLFYQEHGPAQLSHMARHFLAGLLRHAKGTMALTNPLVNSYKRLVPGYEAPIYATWSLKNRSPFLRVPQGTGAEGDLELRSPDAALNPYLAFSALLTAGLMGIEQQLLPPEPIDVPQNRLSAVERAQLKELRLPGSLGEALSAMEQDSAAAEALGPYLFRHFIEAKRLEWEVYRTQVHAWEHEQYLNSF